MSYILDAIKKSEGERTQSQDNETISLQSGNAFRQKPSAQRRSGLAVVFIGIAAFLVWWFWPSVSDFVAQARQISNQGVAQAESVNGASSGGVNQLENVAKVEAASVSSATTTPASDVLSADSPLPPSNEIKELWQQPADFQARIPDISFSFHVYSQTPEKRTIIINGRRMREGQMVTSKIKLRLITETGVVLHAHDRFFHIDVVEKW